MKPTIKTERSFDVPTRSSVRKRSRKIVITADGVFVIKKLSGLDFMMSKSPVLTIAKSAEIVRKEKSMASALKRAAKEIESKEDRFVRVLLERGIVSETIFKHIHEDGSIEFFLDNVDEKSEELRTSRVVISDETEDEYAISAFDLSDSALAQLSEEVKEFSKMFVAAETEAQLDNFR